MASSIYNIDIKLDYNKKSSNIANEKGLSKADIINNALEMYFNSN